MNVTITLRDTDAEPILRRAAIAAAKFGSYCDYVTRRTYNAPSGDTKEWNEKFRAAKRVVDAFGVDYEQVSEQETITVTFDHIGGTTKMVKLPGIGNVGWRSGAQPDYKNPRPCFYSSVHQSACEAAADRTVRHWKAITQKNAA